MLYCRVNRDHMVSGDPFPRDVRFNKNKHGARTMAGIVYVLGKDRSEVYKSEMSFNFSVENFDTVFYHRTMRM